MICSHCDYTPCRCSPEAIERRRREDESSKWMSYEEYKANERLYKEREQELLRSWGLGWIAEFCSTPFKAEDERNK